MNLQINLLFDTERRSASLFNRKAIIRTSSIVVPVVVLVLVAMLMGGAQLAKQSRQNAESEETQLDRDYRSFLALEREFKKSQTLAQELDILHKSRLAWSQLLGGVQLVVSTNMQLTQLTFNESIGIVDNVPAQKGILNLKGKVVGDRPEEDVRRFNQALRDRPVFTSIVQHVRVKGFKSAGTVGNKAVRIFEVECEFVPRKIVAPKTPVKK